MKKSTRAPLKKKIVKLPKIESQQIYLDRLLDMKQIQTDKNQNETNVKIRRFFDEAKFVADKYSVDFFTYKVAANNSSFTVPMVSLNKRMVLHYNTKRKMFFKKPLQSQDQENIDYEALLDQAIENGQAFTPQEIYEKLNLVMDQKDEKFYTCDDEGIEYQTDSDGKVDSKPVAYSQIFVKK